MIVKHIDNKVEDNSLVFLSTSPRGTMLYDYNKEVFLVVDGFSLVGPHRCTYCKDSVKETPSLQKAYKMLYDK